MTDVKLDTYQTWEEWDLTIHDRHLLTEAQCAYGSLLKWKAAKDMIGKRNRLALQLIKKNCYYCSYTSANLEGLCSDCPVGIVHGDCDIADWWGFVTDISVRDLEKWWCRMKLHKIVKKGIKWFDAQHRKHEKIRTQQEELV